MKATQNRRTVTDRLFAKLQQMPSGCIEFTGKRLPPWGYGIIHEGGRGQVRYMRVHRLVFELNNGPIADGIEICHSCDNPPCANPDHLFAGTKLDNMKDMSRKYRSHCDRKTHCINGHEFTPENTIPRKTRQPDKMGRRCRTCTIVSARRKQARREAARRHAA